MVSQCSKSQGLAPRRWAAVGPPIFKCFWQKQTTTRMVTSLLLIHAVKGKAGLHSRRPEELWRGSSPEKALLEEETFRFRFQLAERGL